MTKQEREAGGGGHTGPKDLLNYSNFPSSNMTKVNQSEGGCSSGIEPESEDRT
jgi:hypothetical protein